MQTSSLKRQLGSASSTIQLVPLLAMTCGLIAANLYYAQPLAGPISHSLGLATGASGLIVTLTQIGYCLGLLLVVPLGDLLENRRLVLMLLGGSVVALATASWADSAILFLTASLFIGMSSVAVQVLVPYAAHLAPQKNRGRVVGHVMGGLMLGIMLSRPIASIVAEYLSWRAVFVISALLMASLALILRLALPPRQPTAALPYGRLLLSMAALLRTNSVLQHRAICHAFVFGAFSLFWTTVPFYLADTFHLSQSGIALFALAGVAGAIAAPVTGHMADRGWSKMATVAALLSVAAAFLISKWTNAGSPTPLALLTTSAILLDFGVTAHFVLGQRELFALAAELRSRLNGLYMAIFFAGGAVGSTVGGWVYMQGGWSYVSWTGVVLPLVALTCNALKNRITSATQP